MVSTSPSSEDDSLSVEPSPWGREPAEHVSELWEGLLDQEVEEEERDSIPSDISICETHNHHRHSASAAVGPELQGMLARAPSLKTALQDQSVHSDRHLQCRHSAPL